MDSELKYIDLKAGIDLPAARVRSVSLMTNGVVRVYFDQAEESEQPSPLAAMVNESKQELAAVVESAKLAESNRKLSEDMASGPGAKKRK